MPPPEPAQLDADAARARGAVGDLALGLRALRARQWLHFVPLPLAGAPLSQMVAGTCPLGPVLWGCLAAAACLACAYGLNAHADRATDGRRKNPLAGRAAGALSVVPALVCAGVALLAAGYSGGLIAAGTSLATGALYSTGPRIKRWPGLGSLANAAIFAPLLALVEAPREPVFWGIMVVFTALLLQNQLVHERADEGEDRRAGARTSAQLLGRAGVARVGRWLALLGAIAAWPLLGPPAGLAAAFGLVFGAWLIGQPDAAAARRRHRALALITGAAVYVLGGAA